MRGRGWFGWGGGGRGMGFGFRGSSPPWPYVGRGRGGLPRCGYFFSGVAGAPAATAYPTDPGFYSGPSPYPSYTPQMGSEQELDSLKNQADMLKSQLDQIEARMRNLEKEE